LVNREPSASLKPAMSDHQDARWITAFRMQAGVLQELDEALRWLRRACPPLPHVE
jgi:hypothetical protein